MANLPSLTCKDCGHVNEGERIYCHSCGVKLDRTNVVADAPPRTEESAEARKRRVRRMMNPNERGRPGRWIKTGIRTLILATLAAAAINIARPPEEVPEIPEVTQARGLETLVENLVRSPGNTRLILTQNDVNDYLRVSIRPGAKETGALRFVRVYSLLDKEGIEIVIHRTLVGYPIYMGTRFSIGAKGGQFHAEPQSGYIGRLVVPKAIFPLLDKAFAQVWGTLERDHELMKRVGEVRLGDEEITLYSKASPPPGARPAPARVAPAPATEAPATGGGGLRPPDTKGVPIEP